MSQNYRYTPPSPSIYLPLTVVGLFGGIVGFLTAQGNFQLMFPYFLFGACIFAAFAIIIRQFVESHLKAGLLGIILFFLIGFYLISFSYAILLMIIGYIIGRMTLWIHSGDYR